MYTKIEKKDTSAMNVAELREWAEELWKEYDLAYSHANMLIVEKWELEKRINAIKSVVNI